MTVRAGLRTAALLGGARVARAFGGVSLWSSPGVAVSGHTIIGGAGGRRPFSADATSPPGVILPSRAAEAAYAAHDAALKRAAEDDDAASSVDSSETEEAKRYAHNARQARVFSGETAEAFATERDGELPREVDRKLRTIIQSAQLESHEDGPWRVLDVGCGAGVLVERVGFATTIVGIDLSADMVAACRAKFGKNAPQSPLSISETCSGRSAFWVGDVVDFPEFWLPRDGESEPDASFSPDIPTEVEPGKPFDCAIFNACFGNLYDQRRALEAAAQVVRPGGVIIVGHPLGADYVDALRRRDPGVVPHDLPMSFDAMRDLTKIVSSAPTADDDDDLVDEKVPPAAAPGFKPSFLLPRRLQREQGYYEATWVRRGHAPLEQPLLLRGPVQRGYGRGSKELGFPTANLPEDLFFGDALRAVAPGVYACWAHVEGDAAVRAAVANVGYSPTFAGAENAGKIVEAFLIDRNPEEGDFYGKTMTVLLAAFVRPERKFGSLDALMTQIARDVRTAYAALVRRDRYLAGLKAHPLLNTTAEAPHTPVLATWLDDLDDLDDYKDSVGPRKRGGTTKTADAASSSE